MKIFTFNKFIFIVVAFFLLIYLKDQLVKTALVKIININTNIAIPILVLIFITFFYTVLNFRFWHIQQSIVKTLTLFFLTTYIVSIVFSLCNSFGGRFMYGSLLLPFTIFWFFYLFIQNYSNMRFIITVISIVILVLIYTYFQTINIAQNYSGNETSMNSSYFVMYMLPFLLCVKNKIIKYALIITVLIVVFSSLKRTGTIAVVLAVLGYFYVNFIIKGKKNSNTILFVALISMIMYIITTADVFSDSFLITRFQNILEDQGSGRVDVWKDTWSMIKESSISKLVFGHGFNQVVVNSPIGLSAHNDFLEVLYDYGLLIFGIYLTIYFQLAKFVNVLIKQKSEYAAPMAASCLLFLIGTVLSHIVLYTYYLIMFAMFWGLVLGNVNNKARLLLKLDNK